MPNAPTAFEPTRWSLVIRARSDDESVRREALESLCNAYWFPLYTFLRRSGRSLEDAQDLTQDLFAKLLNGSLLDAAAPARGKFRTLLLAALRRVDVDAWRAANAQKRGGGTTVISFDSELAEERFLADQSLGGSADAAFDRAWAAALIERAWARLRLSYTSPEMSALFLELSPRLSGDRGDGTLADVGTRLGMTESAVKKAFSRMRRRFGEALRLEVTETVGSREEEQEELSHLLALFP